MKSKLILLLCVFLAFENAFAQNIGIGTALPQTKLHVNSTDAIIIPSGNTIQQPNITVSGGLRYNSETHSVEFFDGNIWISIVPTGTILPFAGSSAPNGWLLCDGSQISRTTYSPLFSVVGINWGEGDGTTTFHLPDLRGRFLRGVDGTANNDPDKNVRTASNIGGNIGNSVGSVQGDAINVPYLRGQYWGFSPDGMESTINPVPPFIPITDDNFAGLGVSHPNYTGNENRPQNANVNYIIKY